MTDLDTPATPTSVAALPKRPGLWRIVSIVAVLAAVAVGAVSVLQARDASDVPQPERPAFDFESATVTVKDLLVPDDAQVGVLGLADASTRRGFNIDGTKIDLPEDMAAAIALYDGNGTVMGLALVTAEDDADRRQVEISAASTARALLALAPGILGRDLAETLANVGVVEEDAAFARLVDAVKANPSLAGANVALEVAFAEIADRLPADDPLPDQGCDSIADPSAYASSGACVKPETDGLLVMNEQDRWALIYDGADGWTSLCTVITPAETAGSERLVLSSECTGQALMVAPGPIVNQGINQPLIEDRVRTAAAVNLLHTYVASFVDLAGAGAGFATESTRHIRRNADEIVAAIDRLVADSDEFSAAMDVTAMASTAIDRHLSAVAATRLLIEASDADSLLIPQRAINDRQHLQLLDFYSQAGERMVASRTDWRWEADAVGTIEFGSSS